MSQVVTIYSLADAQKIIYLGFAESYLIVYVSR